jgi:molecular chaperone GrpE (heat shock protein)
MDPENTEEEKDKQSLPEPTTDELKQQLDEAIAQRDEYLNGWQRAKADFMNYKKGEAKNLDDLSKYGNEKIIKELLSILQTFDLALEDMQKKGAVDKGIELIRSQFEDVLKRRGIEKIELKPGDMFDPATAEAMMEVEADGPPGSIVEIMEPGYRLHEKVLRAAKVSINK